MAAQEQRVYKSNQGIVEIVGNFVEVATIKLVTKPSVTRTVSDDKRCWCFYIHLFSGERIEVLVFDPVDCINHYEKVIQYWVGVKPSDHVDLRDILDRRFFKDTDYE